MYNECMGIIRKSYRFVICRFSYVGLALRKLLVTTLSCSVSTTVSKVLKGHVTCNLSLINVYYGDLHDCIW